MNRKNSRVVFLYLASQLALLATTSTTLILFGVRGWQYKSTEGGTRIEGGINTKKGEWILCPEQDIWRPLRPGKNNINIEKVKEGKSFTGWPCFGQGISTIIIIIIIIINAQAGRHCLICLPLHFFTPFGPPFLFFLLLLTLFLAPSFSLGTTITNSPFHPHFSYYNHVCSYVLYSTHMKNNFSVLVYMVYRKLDEKKK